MPHLVELGSPRLYTPARKHLEAAVAWLLQAPLSKWDEAWERWLISFHKLAGQIGYEAAQNKFSEMNLDAEEFPKFKKSVLAISRHLGLLGSRGIKHGVKQIEGDPDYPVHQSLERWATLAALIQSMFLRRELHRRTGENVEREVGNLSIYLSFKAGAPSVHIRPRDLGDALVYCAALMIARGTTAQTCDKCGGPFLEGGDRAGNKKRRGGARFCSDKCRYAFHYDARRKKRL
jgi:hypothetical protein